MEEKPSAVNLTVNMMYQRGYTGMLIGQCIEVPEIVVQSETFQELSGKVFKALEGYFKAFPEQRKKIFEKYGKVISEGKPIEIATIIST